MDGWNPALAASWATLALVLEPESRRQEITLFLVPKFLETAFRLLRKRGLARNVPGWELLVFGLAMGILNIFYQHEVNLLINYVDIEQISAASEVWKLYYETNNFFHQHTLLKSLTIHTSK